MDLTGKRVAVTGATGFLGAHLVRELLARGATVVGAVRTPSKGAWLAEQGVELVQADIGDADSLVPAFEGCDAVIANAALSVRGRSPSVAAFREANLRGAENQLRATARAGVRRLVHISTVAVYRPRLCAVNGHDRMLLDRRIPLSVTWVTTNWRYALSKAEGERLVSRLSDELGVGTTFLRPGPIYGSGDPKLTTTYRQLMTRRFAPAPTARLPHVHAGDVAQAACGALANDASAGRAYNVTGPIASVHDILSTWTRLTGEGPRLLPIPVPLWIDFDDTPARTDLGFAPRTIAAGLEEVLAA